MVWVCVSQRVKAVSSPRRSGQRTKCQLRPLFSPVFKRKLGEAVKSKKQTAQRNEVLAKVLASNLTVLVSAYHELGIAADFAPGRLHIK
jgi:hypothetical protein